jgi:hypothetical protein
LYPLKIPQHTEGSACHISWKTTDLNEFIFEALPNVIYIGPTGRDQSVDGKKKSSDLKSFIIAAVAFGRTSEIGQLRQVRTIYI